MREVRMIIKKIANAILEQNWFTVVLEVLIVVVGIFIGLQVDDWNETRKDRLREIEYLQRVDEELAEDISHFESGISGANRRIGDARLVLAASADPTFVARDPTAFIRALVRAGFTYSPVVSDHTFEEIKSAGELDIIGDIALRVSITKYYQQVRQYSQWGYLREMNQTEYLKRQAGILTPAQFEAFWSNRVGTEITSEEAIAAIDKLGGKQEFIDWLPITIAFLAQDRSYCQLAKESAENLREKISASLETEPSDRSNN
jgi:hypothetical protein